jgi:hypothetical protein
MNNKQTSLLLAVFLSCLSTVALGQRPFATAVEAEAGTTLSPAARGALARQFVLKWGRHIERVYDVPVGVWAKRMVPSFVSADPTNFRNALQRTTFEGAMAELSGQGARLSDPRALIRLQQASASLSQDAPTKALGDVSADLVFTPLQPCRVVDTRNTVEGPIAANAERSFRALSISFTGQGGSATDCGTQALSFASVVALSVTAVFPNQAGFATVFPYNTSRPLAASVNYPVSGVVNNFVVTRIPNPLTNFDFNIYTFAQSHYVVDIVGYYSAPQATPLQCVQSTLATVDMPINGSATVFSPSCPAGYTKTSTSCDTTSTQAYLTISALGGCQGRNTSASIQQLSAQATCCRVPGR